MARATKAQIDELTRCVVENDMKTLTVLLAKHKHLCAAVIERVTIPYGYASSRDAISHCVCHGQNEMLTAILVHGQPRDKVRKCARESLEDAVKENDLKTLEILVKHGGITPDDVSLSCVHSVMEYADYRFRLCVLAPEGLHQLRNRLLGVLTPDVVGTDLEKFKFLCDAVGYNPADQQLLLQLWQIDATRNVHDDLCFPVKQ